MEIVTVVLVDTELNGGNCVEKRQQLPELFRRVE